MRIYDVTKDLSESSDLYPGDPPTVFHRISDIELHDSFTLTSFSMGAHAGTHIDAPWPRAPPSPWLWVPA